MIDVVPVFSTHDKDWEDNYKYSELPDMFEQDQFLLAGSSGKWIMAAPKRRREKLDDTDALKYGRVKKVIRLLKAWKYYNNIPINSYFLETYVLHLSEKYSFSEHPQLDFFRILCNIRHHFHQDNVSIADPFTWSIILPCSKSDFYYIQKRTDESAYYATAAIEAEHFRDLNKALDYWEIAIGKALADYVY